MAKPAKAVVKAAKVVETVAETAVVAAMDVVPARMVRAAMLAVTTPSRPSSVSLRQTTALLPRTLMRNRLSTPMDKHPAARTVNPVRSAPATATAVSAAPVVSAANVKSVRTCASRSRSRSHLRRLVKQQLMYRKQHLKLLPLQQPSLQRRLPHNRSAQPHLHRSQLRP